MKTLFYTTWGIIGLIVLLSILYNLTPTTRYSQADLRVIKQARDGCQEDFNTRNLKRCNELGLELLGKKLSRNHKELLKVLPLPNRFTRIKENRGFVWNDSIMDKTDCVRVNKKQRINKGYIVFCDNRNYKATFTDGEWIIK